METRDHKKCIAGNREKHRVRKPAQKSATDVLEYDGELLWIDAEALGQSVNRFTKMPA